ncbi:MAG TPA: hypothetical protein VG826_18050 [Pirellulales bacterium]|nr:hypothetical protein [Pirellulales bacterium]
MQPMICFDILVNGRKLCTAGVGDPGTLHAHIIWVLRHGQFDYSGTPGTDDETIGLTVDGDSYGRQECLSWPNTNLKAGDEVTIRVVDLESADEPTRVKMDEQTIRRILEPRRAMYEKLKREFENSPDPQS